MDAKPKGNVAKDGQEYLLVNDKDIVATIEE